MYLSKLKLFLIFKFRLPESIVFLQNLTHLKLNDVNLTELPSDFGRYVFYLYIQLLL